MAYNMGQDTQSLSNVVLFPWFLHSGQNLFPDLLALSSRVVFVHYPLPVFRAVRLDVHKKCLELIFPFLCASLTATLEYFTYQG